MKKREFLSFLDPFSYLVWCECHTMFSSIWNGSWQFKYWNDLLWVQKSRFLFYASKQKSNTISIYICLKLWLFVLTFKCLGTEYAYTMFKCNSYSELLVAWKNCDLIKGNVFDISPCLEPYSMLVWLIYHIGHLWYVPYTCTLCILRGSSASPGSFLKRCIYVFLN